MRCKEALSVAIVALLMLLSSCASYYQRNIKFQEMVVNGKFQEASNWLSKDKKSKKNRHRLLYLLNKGFVSFMMGNYTESNKLFIEADLLMENTRANLGEQALALISTPTVKPYVPEDHERVMVHFYTALAFIQQGNMESALVEARRVNLELSDLNNKYKAKKNRYSSDAFAQILMGLAYERNRDYNNAFVAYRNALETFENIYSPVFGVSVPDQLKHDIIRMAKLTGFSDEVEFYQKKFGFNQDIETFDASAIIFWSSGFGPVKTQRTIEFYLIPLGSNNYQFLNNILGINLTLNFGDLNKDQKAALDAMKVIRLAFPRYLKRVPLFNQASVQINGEVRPFQLIEPIDLIAEKTLEDRMLRESGQALARLVAKKTLEIAVRSQNKTAGDITSLAGAISEQADTRNWQTLPAKIYYARIPLKPGNNSIEFNSKSNNGEKTENTKFEINQVLKGNLYFINQHSLSTSPPVPF